MGIVTTQRATSVRAVGALVLLTGAVVMMVAAASCGGRADESTGPGRSVGSSGPPPTIVVGADDDGSGKPAPSSGADGTLVELLLDPDAVSSPGDSSALRDLLGTFLEDPVVVAGLGELHAEAALPAEAFGGAIGAPPNVPPDPTTIAGGGAGSKEGARPTSHQAGKLHLLAQVGVDVPEVERRAASNTIALPAGGSVDGEVTTELRVEQRRLHFEVTEGLAVDQSSGETRLSVETRSELGACPTDAGVVSGTISRDFVLGFPGPDGTLRRTEIHATARIEARLGADRRPVGYALEDLEIQLVGRSGDDTTNEITLRGRVDGLDATDELSNGDPEVHISARSQNDAEAANASFGWLLGALHTHASGLLAQVRSVTESGLCVRVEVDRHGMETLLPGVRAPLDVRVVDAVTGDELGLPVQAVALRGSISPDLVPAAPGVFSVAAGGGRAPYTMIVWTEGIRGAHTVEVVYQGTVGWTIDTMVGPFAVTGVKCGGPAGTWVMTLSANFDGGVFSGEVRAELDETTLEGPYGLVGQTVGGPVAVQQRGAGRITFRTDDDGAAWLELDGDSWAAWIRFTSAGGEIADTGRVELDPASGDDCEGHG